MWWKTIIQFTVETTKMAKQSQTKRKPKWFLYGVALKNLFWGFSSGSVYSMSI